MNKMEEMRIEKVTLNLGTGGPGERLDKAMKLLFNITGAKPLPTRTKKRIATWGIRPGLSIGCKVTIRGEKANLLFKRLAEAKNHTLNSKNFDSSGNLSFGIPEYLDIPGAEYDMSIGIIGLEAAVTLERPGFRIARRKIKKRKLPKKVRIKRDETINFISSTYGVKIEGE